VAKQRRKSQGRWAQESKQYISGLFVFVHSSDYTCPGQLGFNAWKKENENGSIEEFEEHWAALPRSAKNVRDFLSFCLILSYASLPSSEVHE
jgi:hypothetical protein